MYIIVLLFIFVTTSVFAEKTIYPVIWTKEISVSSLKDIPKILKNEKVSEVEYINDKNDTAIAKTCKNYFKLTDAGFYPKNNAEIAKESYFKKKCEPLKLLMRFQPAQRSYLRNLNLKEDYGLLPAAIIFPALFAENEKNGDVKALYPDAYVELNKDKNSITIISKKADMKTYVSLLAWGDFNHDGYDDVLIFVANYALHGSYHSYSNYLLTKKSEKGPYLVVLPAKIGIQ